MFPRAGFCFQFLVTKGTDYFSLKSNSLREYNNIFFSAVLGKESHSKRAPSTPSARGSCPQPTAASTWTFSLREMVHHRDRQTDRRSSSMNEATCTLELLLQMLHCWTWTCFLRDLGCLYIEIRKAQPLRLINQLTPSAASSNLPLFRVTHNPYGELTEILRRFPVLTPKEGNQK